jgi:PAS domain S-box-containing protein
MDSDRNLLFGVLALQADLIDSVQFVEACTLWTTRKQAALADLLVERGWIAPADKEHVEYLVERKLQKHGGDAQASLADAPDHVKRSLAALDDADIQRSLAGLPPSENLVLDETVDLAVPRSRYSLTRLHATGGIGRIWLARDADLGRDVALKELRPERADDPSLWVRFLKEAKITGQLAHPGIVPVYELARRPENQQPFYTMQFVKGRTLTEAARCYHRQRAAGQADSLEFVNLLNAFVTVCNTIAYAHARGVIHRDLKGQNVVLGDFGEVIVLDWGLAKLMNQPDPNANIPPIQCDSDQTASPDLTAEGQTVGTPAYMAPEQAAGRPDLIDRRTDVYGLGAMLYEILTGQPPFLGTNTLEVLRKVREEVPTPPRSIWPDVPPALEDACLRALAKQPADRPASAGEMAQAVLHWQEMERRKAEEALRASEALYHSLVETLPLSVWRKDLKGRFIFANERFCASVGRPLAEVIGKTDFDFFPAELAAKYRQDDMRVHETARIVSVAEDHVTADGQKLYVHVVKAPVLDAHGKVIGTQGIFWDLTEWKRTEEELRKSRERFELAVQGSQDGLWDWDLTTDEVYYSPRYKAMLGYKEHEFPNRREEWEKRVHPDDLERVKSELRAHFRSRESLSWVEFRFRHKDGSYRWIRSRAFVLRDPTSGRVYRMAGSHEDITDRKNAEEELRKSRERFELAVLGSQDGLWDWDIEANAVWYSSRVRTMLGYTEEEYPNQPGETEKRVHPDDHERWRAALYGHVAGLTPQFDLEYRIRHQDGSYRWVRGRGIALRDTNGKAYRMAGSVEDIDARKRAEEALRQAAAELARVREQLNARQ